MSLFEVNAILYLAYIVLSISSEETELPKDVFALLFVGGFALGLMCIILYISLKLPVIMFILLTFSVADKVAKKLDL